MALQATLYRVQIALSDVDRGVYESLDLRLARHPSESLRYLVTRTLAYCLLYEEGIAFSHGLFESEEPAVWVKSPQGSVALWVDIGLPSPERLHRASKAAGRVVIFTHHEPEQLVRQARGKVIHRAAEIEVVRLHGPFLDALGEALDRNGRWELVHTGGQLYVTVNGKVHEGSVTREEGLLGATAG